MLLTILAVLTGVCLYSAVHHAWIGLRHPLHPMHIWFSLLSLCITAYVLAKFHVYQAPTPEALVVLRRVEFTFAFAALGVLPWFIRSYTGTRNRAPALALGATALFLLICNLYLPNGLVFSEVPELKHMQLPWGEQIVDLRTLPQGGWYQFAWSFIVLDFLYCLYLGVQQYRCGERRRAATLLAALMIFFACVLFNRVVNAGLVNFTHTAEFGYVALILLMGSALSHELRAAGAALAASEARFRTLMEQAADAIYLVDCEGRFVAVNQQGCASLGYTRAELLRMSVADIEVDVSLAQVKSIWNTLQPGVPVTLEGRNRRKDGSTFPTEIRVGLFQGDGGPLALAIIRNVSERLRTRQLLLEAQRLGKMGSWELDVRTGATAWSAETYRIFEVDPGSFTLNYTNYLALIHPDDRSRIEAAYHAHLTRHTPYEIQHRALLAGGRIKHLRCKGETEYIDNQPVRSFGMVQDVTELVTSEQSLRESERRLRQAVQMARLGMWDWNPESDTSVWQGKMFDIYGITPEQFTGKGRDYMSLTREDYRDARDENLKQILANGITEEQIARGEDLPLAPVELCVVRPDGREIYTMNESLAVVDGHGKLLRIVGITMDITAIKRAEDEIRKLNTQLEQRVRDRTAQLEFANRELESFSYSVSHDLRAPLRAIDGYAHVLAEEYADRLDATAHAYITRMRNATQRLGELIDDMLNLSRLSRVPMQRERVNLSAMAREIINELQRIDPERDVEVVIAPDVTAKCDPSLLHSALHNLFGNAWKYTRRTPRPRIEFGVTLHDQERCFFVRDNGAGFEMQYAGKLFAPFQRLHKPAEYEGSGIGLASASRIISRHGGRIWAHAEPNRGATFYFTLPE